MNGQSMPVTSHRTSIFDLVKGLCPKKDFFFSISIRDKRIFWSKLTIWALHPNPMLAAVLSSCLELFNPLPAVVLPSLPVGFSPLYLLLFSLHVLSCSTLSSIVRTMLCIVSNFWNINNNTKIKHSRITNIKRQRN